MLKKHYILGLLLLSGMASSFARTGSAIIRQRRTECSKPAPVFERVVDKTKLTIEAEMAEDKAARELEVFVNKATALQDKLDRSVKANLAASTELEAKGNERQSVASGAKLRAMAAQGAAQAVV